MEMISVIEESGYVLLTEWALMRVVRMRIIIELIAMIILIIPQ